MADVLIIGATPSSLILANMLIQHQIDVKLIDQRAPQDLLSASPFNNLPIILSSSSLELLDAAGLLEDLVSMGHKFFGVRYHWKKHTVLFKFAQTANSRFPYSLGLTLGDLTSHLIQTFEKQGGVIHWSTRPVTLVDDSIFIEKTKDHQNFSNREIYTPKWIIAGEPDDNPDVLDLFKNQLKIKKITKEALFVLCDESEPFEEDHIHFLPLAKSFLNFVFYNHTQQAKQLYLPSSATVSPKLKQRLLYTNNLAVTNEEQHIKITSHIYPPNHRRTLFIGTMANNLTFSYVNGVNSNIHAAFNLGWKLIPVLKQAASTHLINIKEKELGNILPHFSEKPQGKVQKLFLSNLYTPALMYYFLRGFRQLESHGGELYYPSHKALKYQNSDIIKMSLADKEIRGPKPGDRAIDMLLEDGSYLLDSLKNAKHLFLFFKERKDLQQALIEEYSDWLDVFTVCDPKAFKLYHANPESFFIIRPDRYIGYRTHSFKLHELISYLLRIFSSEKPAHT